MKTNLRWRKRAAHIACHAANERSVRDGTNTWRGISARSLVYRISLTTPMICISLFLRASGPYRVPDAPEVIPISKVLTGPRLSFTMITRETVKCQ